MFLGGFFSRHHYIGEKLNRNLLALYVTRLSQSVTLDMMFLYGPIFLFVLYGNSLKIVLLYYTFSFLAYGLTLPLGAKIMSKVGMRTSMIIATLFLTLWMVGFYFFEADPKLFYFLTILSITIFRSLFWVPYHTEIAEFTDRWNRGKEVALLRAVMSVLRIGTPITAGFIIIRFGYDAMFVVAAIIALLSIVPMIFMKEKKEEFTYGYFETFRKLFARSKKNLLFSHMALGAEGMFEVVVWPIFIFIILDASILNVGAVSSLVVFALVIIQLIMGSFSDKYSKTKLMRLGTIFLATGWIFRSLVQNAPQIFMAKTYYNFGTAIFQTPYIALYYERAADNGHYVDEYTVLREISLNIGRVIVLLSIIVITHYFSISSAFFVAAISALLVGLF
ncbi:MFS transporter [Patescibacteria group bacterium]